MPNGYLRQRRKRHRLLSASLAAVTLTSGTAALLWAWPDGDFLPATAVGPGHGRGLSQNGAFEQAVDGWTSDRILAHYYVGSSMGTIGPTTVRVRIQEQDNEPLAVVSDSAFFVAGRRVIPGQSARLSPTATGADVTITQGCDGATLWEGDTDDPWAYPGMEGTNRPAEEQLEICGGNAYRGALGVALEGNDARTVNAVDVDDYLMGVVPAEMVPHWADEGGTEALRAQAIAARSYALAESRYDYAQTCDTTDCQMYPGTDKEDPRTSEAVLATSGQVLLRDNHILRSEYSSAPDGGTPTPVESMEIGPSVDEFPAAVTPGLPDLPFFTDPAPVDPETTDPTVTDPTYIDPTAADPTAPGTVDPQLPGTPKPRAEAPVPNPRSRVDAPDPLLPNLFRSLTEQLFPPVPAGPATKPDAHPKTAPSPQRPPSSPGLAGSPQGYSNSH
ncbi:SpoIID/LytB domain-containing protein [Nocardia jejuensis]|uniref:SpoIID/LytB domain-containing protein n=1 Tax=Nocardia jejuensis TaxID=328049 RepID=UPI0008324F84|nr:SpoIID/LytB domain-containing protein [Nocardia jejuensis]